MCASQAAPFLWQKDSFSCRDAHAFNRNSSSQVAACVGASGFPLVTRGFSTISSLRLLSFHGAPMFVLFRFVTDISLARLLARCGARTSTEHLTVKLGRAESGAHAGGRVVRGRNRSQSVVARAEQTGMVSLQHRRLSSSSYDRAKEPGCCCPRLRGRDFVALMGH